jgi:serine/threonine protein kinase/tetratricopeptide (TPR) repeat protein
MAADPHESQSEAARAAPCDDASAPPRPPEGESEFLDWIFDRAVDLLEDGQHAAAEELLLLRPAEERRVREVIELARRVSFGPRAPRPKLSGYILLQELGHGGMGTVWLARQQRLGERLVAVKVLADALGFSPESRARFRAEARTIARLRHPHIVDVYDVIEDDGVHAYAMEWIEGATLAQVIESTRASDASRPGRDSMAPVRDVLLGGAGGDVPPGAAEPAVRPAPPADRSYVVFVCRVGAAIARALGAVHRAGLVHRDVKPSNILLRRDGTPLLSDFGLALGSDPDMLTRLGTAAGGHATGTAGSSFVGTAAFAAPEQLRADGGEIDRRIDIYALGVTLYAALAQRLPFQGRTHVEVLRQIQLGLAAPLRRINPRVPRDLGTIVGKAMESEPARRYQTADELAEDLERLLKLQPIRARPAGPVTRFAKLARRNRPALIGAVGAAVLVIAMVAMALTVLIGFPKWSRAHLDQARLLLIDPDQSDAIFSALFWDVDEATALSPAARQADQALREYDAALGFAPFDDDIRQERDLVRLARTVIARSQAAPIPFPRHEVLPLTADFAAQVTSDLGLATLAPSDAQLKAASSDDLRSLGFLALLCCKTSVFLVAWGELDRRGHPDALVEASLGVAYLVSGEPGRAYPRLRRATQEFPATGFLTVYLAEAALGCGDVTKAQQWLEQARSLGQHDRHGGLKRVQAGVHAAAGDDAAARRLYEELEAANQNVVAFLQYAEFLEARDELDHALLLYLRVLNHGVEHLRARRRFVGAVERWWAAQGPEDRAALVAASAPPRSARPDRGWILPVYEMSVRILGVEPALDGLPGPPPVAGP